MDIHLDEKVQAIESLHKNDGFVWIIKFWQKAYSAGSGEVDLNGIFGVIQAENSRITPEKQEEIIRDCVQIGLLTETQPGVYTSNGVQRRLDAVIKNRENDRKRKEKELSASIPPENPAETGEIKLKEIKLKKSKEDIKTWRNHYWTYLKSEIIEYNKAIKDEYFIKQQSELNPNLDIKLSLKKAHLNFWGKKAGWQFKKKKKSASISWRQTFTNAIDRNKVYKPRPQGGGGVSSWSTKPS